MKQPKLKKWETNTSALTIAKYLLSYDPQRKYFTKKEGNFRLNSLLHITQMLHCAKYGKLAFQETMIAYPPQWWKLSEAKQNELAQIIHNQKIKNKKALIAKLYQTENIKLSLAEKNLYWAKEKKVS